MIRPLSAKASGVLLGRPPLPIVRIKQAKPAHQTKSEPAAGRAFEASSFIVVLSDLAGPGERGVRAARTRAVPLCRFATFPPPRGGIFPKPLPALPFLVGRKGSKRPFKGTTVPLKIPCWGALWPRPQTPRPETLVVTTDILRANRCAPFAGKFLRFIGLPQNQATVRQPISPVLGAGCSESSQCNLSLFRANWAGC